MKRFPHFDEVEIPEEVKGWEELYPYYLLFGHKNRVDFEKSKFWFADFLHFPAKTKPLEVFTNSDMWHLGLMFYNTRYWPLPASLGIDHRIFLGQVYLSANDITDPEEIQKRTEIFQKRASYYFENWDRLLEKWKEKVTRKIEEIRNLEFPERLPELESDDVVYNAEGLSTGYKIIRDYNNLMDSFLEIWNYHFEFFLCYGVALTFFDFCKKVFPGIPDEMIGKMIAGFDSVLWRPDAECRRLAKLAVELGIDEVITSKHQNLDELFEELKKSENGKKWVEEFEKVKYPWFYYSEGYGFQAYERRWVHNLDIPLGIIATYIDEIKKGKYKERSLEEIQKERDRITEEYRNMIEDEDVRRQFDELVGLARKVFPFAEDHGFYIEHWFHTVWFDKLRDIGRLLKNYDFIREVDDIFFLKRTEIYDALMDLVISWAVGTPPAGPSYWPPIIERRKEIYKNLEKIRVSPALGAVPEEIKEPLTIMLWGVTKEKVDEWLKGVSAGEEDKVIQGHPGSPGVVEGTARVCLRVDEIANLQDGEILVTSTTAPSWAPAFTKIKAVVTDIGGVMSHAAIVAREYGIPAVVGTGVATRRVKSGMKIRVDGSKGTVEILE